MSWEDLVNNAIGTPAATPSGGGASVRTGGATGGADYAIRGLVDRGLPEHVARGFAMNFADESGFDPGINEKNPIVPGSRGGYGLYQVTGPRRRAYEAFAAQSERSLDDVDAQLDFLVWELNNTEKRARDRILATRTPGEAGAAIVNDFLRPAAEHRQKRAAKYLNDGGSTRGPTYDNVGGSRAEPTYNRLWLG